MIEKNENQTALVPSANKTLWARAGSRLVSFGESRVFKTLGVAGAAMTAAAAHAQTDATVIATNALTAFGTVAPITITIVGFYVILRIVKKVV